MKNRTVLVLGGYGGAGSIICKGVLKETEVDIIIAGRRKEEAEEQCKQLNREFSGNRVSWLFADASDLESLRPAFHGTDIVIVCSNTAEHADIVARAAIDSGCDYLDIHFSEAHTPKLLALRDEMEDRGRCFITQAGSHPGMAPAFIRYASSRFESIRKVIIGGTLKIKKINLEAAKTFLKDMSESRSLVYRDGKWQKANGKDNLKINFGPDFGRLTCYPTYIYEMEDIPNRFQIDEAGVYMSGLNWFVDWFAIIPAYLLSVAKNKFTLDLLAHFTVWGVSKFTRSPVGFVYKMEAYGKMEGEEKMMEITTFHTDPYVHTAVPIVSCIRQYLEGTIKKPGLWMMGHIVDPDRLISDMERMGIEIQIQVANNK